MVLEGFCHLRNTDSARGHLHRCKGPLVVHWSETRHTGWHRTFRVKDKGLEARQLSVLYLGIWKDEHHRAETRASPSAWCSSRSR